MLIDTVPGTFVPPYNGSDISSFLTPFGKYDLLEYMNTCVLILFSASYPTFQN